MIVPFIDLTRIEKGFEERWLKKVHELSMTSSFIGGPEISLLEDKLCDYLSVENAVTCANGTDAIQLALRAVGVTKDDIVLLPDLTFWATFEAVVNVGGTPVTVDISLQDGCLDINSLLSAMDLHNPKAVIIAHLYGWGSMDLLAIRNLCESRNIPLIEDGAQSFGVRVQDESIYKNAFISTTSFYPAKVLGGAGDGGAVFTKSNELAVIVRQLSNHGRSAHYGHEFVGWNSRMDSLQAAFLNIAIDYIDDRIQSRVKAADFYRLHLNETGLTVLSAPSGYRENGYLNVCLIDNQEQKSLVEDSLRVAGIGFGNVYPSAMRSQAGAISYIKGHDGGKRTDIFSSSVINLPVFPYMRSDELDYVVNKLTSFLKKGNL